MSPWNDIEPTIDILFNALYAADLNLEIFYNPPRTDLFPCIYRNPPQQQQTRLPNGQPADDSRRFWEEKRLMFLLGSTSILFSVCITPQLVLSLMIHEAVLQSYYFQVRDAVIGFDPFSHLSLADRLIAIFRCFALWPTFWRWPITRSHSTFTACSRAISVQHCCKRCASHVQVAHHLIRRVCNTRQATWQLTNESRRVGTLANHLSDLMARI